MATEKKKVKKDPGMDEEKDRDPTPVMEFPRGSRRA